MDRQPYVVGCTIDWCREGDTLTSTNPASRTEAPVAADTGWINLGLVDIVSITKTTNEYEVMSAQPGGQKVLYDVIPLSKMLDFSFTLEEMGPEDVEFIYDVDSALDDSSTTYPILGSKNDKGWLRIKQYDQYDALFNTVLVYVYLQIDGSIDLGNNPTKPVYKAKVLYSTENDGTLVASS